MGALKPNRFVYDKPCIGENCLNTVTRKNSRCQKCCAKKLRVEKKEEIKIKHKAWTEANKDTLKVQRKAFYEANKERLTAEKRAWRAANPDIVAQRNKVQYLKDPEHHKAKHKEWKAKNPGHQAAYARKRLLTNIHAKLAYVLRRRLKQAIRGNFKSGSAVTDLGCSIAEFKLYIEAKFQPGMTWENRSFSGWHLDHVRPLASFDLTDRSQFLEACHYTNLQPLWASENMSKQDKWEPLDPKTPTSTLSYNKDSDDPKAS